MAPRAVAARGADLCFLPGTAAAGIAKFQVGRAGFPVADTWFVFLVSLAAGTGVCVRAFRWFNGIVLFVVGCGGSWF